MLYFIIFLPSNPQMQNLDENLTQYLKEHEIYNLLFQGMEELARH